MSAVFGRRRASWIGEVSPTAVLDETDLGAFERFDAVYRSLCAILYNYAGSGHPGGSISSGRFVTALLFDSMIYDLASPERDDADVISYAAGHKALGLYAMWALRNEIARIAAPSLLARSHDQFRLEDLLGFRRNPTNETPLFRSFGSRPLDGHPTPATPFVRLATGASGVGVASSLGLALALSDWFGPNAPRVNVIEGEGGLTPGRVAEALAFAATASLGNAIVHVDWNQSSIDSDRVTREGDQPGDYVQWDPTELFYLHDWNVIYVADGFDFQRIAAAQRQAIAIDNGQPTAIVYRTTKGWRYGVEGRASHGSGHKLCAAAFFDALPMSAEVLSDVPRCDLPATRCDSGSNATVVEECFWSALTAVRKTLEADNEMTAALGARLLRARARLTDSGRVPRQERPAIEDVFALSAVGTLPPELELRPGTETTLRGQLGRAIGYLNRYSGGAFFLAAADLLNSTSISEGGRDFDQKFFNTRTAPDSRTLSVGGICEDAMTGVLTGVAAFGRHIGAGASYGAFLAPLGHIAARLYAIGSQARAERSTAPRAPIILVCGHAGLKTGEDGPTHADPQPLQLLQENFPMGAAITLTPWDPNEIWYLLTAALSKHPAVIAPFVTRPAEKVIDREALRLAPASEAARGVYRLRKAKGLPGATLVLQESAVTYAFVTEALPLLDADGLDVDVYYVASAELFDLLPPAEQARIFPDDVARKAIGITGFTLPTMARWVRSEFGRSMTMHPFMSGRYPGSGTGPAVIREAGLDGRSQYERILEVVRKAPQLV